MSKTWKEAYNPEWKNSDHFEDFDCSNNKLTSLEGAPAKVDSFDCSYNKLTSLNGAPLRTTGFFDCSGNMIASLSGAPSHIGGCFFCASNELTSLKDIHLQIKHISGFINLYQNRIDSHVLGLLLIKGLTKVYMDREDMEDILNRYLPSKGMESVLLCQEELIMSGREEFAQL